MAESLSGDLTFSNAMAVAAQIERLRAVSPQEVDLAGVSDIDSCGLALLIGFKRDAAQRHVTFLNVPENLRALATLYGVESLLESPTLTAA